MAGCTGNGSGSGIIDRKQWLARTKTLLSESIHLDGERAVFIAPADSAADLYAIALAVTGLGIDAKAAVNDVRSDGVRERIARALTAESIKNGSAPAVYLTRELTRANQAAGGSLLDAQQARRVFEPVVRESIDDRVHRWNAFEVLDVREVSQGIGALTAEVDTWARSNAQTISPPCDASGFNDLGALAAIDAKRRPCPMAVLDRLWTDTADAVGATIAGGGNASLVECEALLSLTRLQVGIWPADRARRDRLVSLSDAVTAAVAANHLADILACSGGALPEAMRLLGVSHRNPSWLDDYLRAVVRTGAEPQEVMLDGFGLAIATRTMRLVGGATDFLAPDLTALPPAERLDLLAARVPPGGSLPPEVDSLLGEVASRWRADDALSTALAMRALAALGGRRCASPLIGIATKLVDAAAGGELRGNSMSTYARAAAALRLCGRPVHGVDAIVAGRSKAIAADLGAGDSANLKVAADAVEALCILRPADLPSQAALWKAYGGRAAPDGGVAGDDRWISLGSTNALAVLAVVDADSCKGTGRVG
jgi:hypothetical protein